MLDFFVKENQKSPLHVRERNNAWINLADRCKNKLESMMHRIYLLPMLVIIFIHSSCNKNELDNDITPVGNEVPAVSRKIQFSLYTDKDFKNENHRIQFSLFIRATDIKLIWDTIFPVMNIRDIPGEANRIFIEKQVPEKDSSLLRTGFIYSIENVGISWHIDTCNKSTAIKKIDFNFQ